MRKIIIIGIISAIVLTCIVFAIPFITLPYYTIETYKDTEIEQEPYTVTEAYKELQMREKEEIIFQGTPHSVPYGISIPFSVSKADARLVGSFELPAPGGFYLYSSSGNILYELLGDRGHIDIPLPEGKYSVLVRERVLWQGQITIDLRLKWTEQVEVTKYKEVTKYRDIPVIKEKQQTVTNYKKVSLWNTIFGH